MCNFFTCAYHVSRGLEWMPGVDSHTTLCLAFPAADDTETVLAEVDARNGSLWHSTATWLKKEHTEEIMWLYRFLRPVWLQYYARPLWDEAGTYFARLGELWEQHLANELSYSCYLKALGRENRRLEAAYKQIRKRYIRAVRDSCQANGVRIPRPIQKVKPYPNDVQREIEYVINVGFDAE